MRTPLWVVLLSAGSWACGSSNDDGLYSNDLFNERADGGGSGGGGGTTTVKKSDAGIGGTISTGGAPPTPTCVGLSASCASASDCCNGLCGGVDASDCNIASQCVECNADGQCPTGRCDECACQSLLGVGASCDEDGDCTNQRCGAGAGADSKDCEVQGQCVECRSDAECATGRCEGCACAEQLEKDEDCNEPTDCADGKCKGGECDD